MRIRSLLIAPPVPLLVLLLGVLCAGVQLPAVSVYLHRTAAPGQDTVLLGDIATVVDADAQLADELRRLPLWRGSGKAGLVPAGLIKRRLAAAADGQVVVVGAHTLLLPVGSQSALEVEFYTKLLEAVAALPGGIFGRIEVELLSPPELPAAGPLEVAVVPAGSQGLRRGTGTAAAGASMPTGGLVQVLYGAQAAHAIDADTGTGSRRGVAAQVRQFLSVAVAARDLPSGTVLSWQELTLEERDITGIPGGFLTAEDRPEAFRTAAPLSRGERVDTSRLERQYLVRAGDVVTVTFLRRGLRVSMPARVYSSGAAGDRVEVKPRDAARRFTGIVGPGGEVFVEEL